MNRRHFLAGLGALAAGMALDPERALWVPGRRTFFDLGAGREDWIDGVLRRGVTTFRIDFGDGQSVDFDGIAVRTSPNELEVRPVDRPVERMRHELSVGPVPARASSLSLAAADDLPFTEIADLLEISLPRLSEPDDLWCGLQRLPDVKFAVKLT